MGDNAPVDAVEKLFPELNIELTKAKAKPKAKAKAKAKKAKTKRSRYEKEVTEKGVKLSHLILSIYNCQ